MTFVAAFASDLDKGLWIMLRGLAVVFAVMALIAGAMWLSGRYFVARDAKEKARLKAEQERRKAEEEQQNAARKPQAVAPPGEDDEGDA